MLSVIYARSIHGADVGELREYTTELRDVPSSRSSSLSLWRALLPETSRLMWSSMFMLKYYGQNGRVVGQV